MATIPISGTNIRFLSNVPFSNDYKHTRWFDSLSEQTAYFLAKPLVHSMSESTFQRIDGQRWVNTDKHIDELWGTNYLMFQNAQYNNKWFYAFVTKLEYVNRKLTRVHFQIDVFQTWKFQMNFKPSFVLREHRPLWNGDNPVINTIDEKLDYGRAYETVSVKQFKPFGNIHFLVVVCKEKMHDGAKEIVPSLNGLPQGLSYYIVPFMLPSGEPPNMTIGAQTPVNGWANAIDVLKHLYTNEGAVGNIVSIYVTDFFGENLTYDAATNTLAFPANAYTPVSHSTELDGKAYIYVNTIPNYDAMTTTISGKWDGFYTSEESKLFMSPYCMIILDDMKGNRVEIRPEYINGDDLQITIRGALGTSNKVTYSVTNYHLDSSKIPDVLGELGGALEYSVINNNPNDIPVLNDYLASYLQGNRNSLENQKAQILFNGAMGGLSAGIAGVSSAGSMLGIGASAVQGVQGLGSTHYAIQGIQAKIQDVSNTPATLAKMGSNSNYDFGYGLTGLFIIKKQIKSEYRKKLEDYFKMFGYKANEVKIPNFHTRQNWNYVQTASCVITGNFNNEDLQELKSIFDNGITFWHTDDIGNYNLLNDEV